LIGIVILPLSGEVAEHLLWEISWPLDYHFYKYAAAGVLVLPIMSDGSSLTILLMYLYIGVFPAFCLVI